MPERAPADYAGLLGDARRHLALVATRRAAHRRREGRVWRGKLVVETPETETTEAETETETEAKPVSAFVLAAVMAVVLALSLTFIYSAFGADTLPLPWASRVE